ncbi:MCE family protein [Allokutzneria albata]|uniref:Virulence factor Mce family protein n=1 Tax=Allokutzneria albata TaxID=211114 RepID=A0A1G9YZS8_ALLAB|nr:MCE family protein [Allokutzneria albata]SDN14659.1 virulence factor Mce family protein [Allokutzneria albata]
MRASAGKVRQRLLGVALLAIIALFLTLTVSIYRNAFSSDVLVSLRTDRAGNQLLTESDVKVHGVLVGEVRRVISRGDGAELELALHRDKVDIIPRGVTARLLPKTLFGERYVALVPPQRSNGDHLAAGDVIAQDTSSSAVELERVLSNLMPVLQAVQPQKLASTLGSLSTALQGRGKALGESLVELNDLVRQLNPALPDLKADISKLADVSTVYDKAAPDLLQALADLTVTSKTLVEQRDNLQTLYGTVNAASADLGGFLSANRNNIIGVAKSSRPLLELLGKYAPEYPCLLKSLAELQPRLSKAFGQGTNEPGLHITLEITANRGKYVPNQDEPEYADKRGPRCYDIQPRPEPFPQYPPEGPVKDGSKPPPAARNASDGLLPTGEIDENGNVIPASATTAARGQELGLANSPAEQRYISALLAPSMGRSPQQVPGWSSILLGPMFRGTEVTLK